MLVEYLSVVRVLRRPMRQWWLRVGIWWLVLLFVISVYRCFYTLEVWPSVVQSSGGTYQTWPYDVLNYILGILRDVVWLVVWLAAATTANSLINRLDLIRATPLARRLPIYRFLLLLSQGFWIVVVSLASSAAEQWCNIESLVGRYPDTLAYGAPEFVIVLGSDLVDKLLVLTWTGALLASVCRRPFLAWLWAVMMYLAGHVAGFSGWLYRLFATSNPAQGSAINLRDWDPTYVWVIGLLLLITMIDGLRNRMPILGFLSYCALILSALSLECLKIMQGNGLLDGLDISLVMALKGIGQWSTGVRFAPAGAVTSRFTGEGADWGRLGITFPPANIAIDIPDWLVILAPAINIIWVLLIWLVLMLLLTRRRSVAT